MPPVQVMFYGADGRLNQSTAKRIRGKELISIKQDSWEVYPPGSLSVNDPDVEFVAAPGAKVSPRWPQGAHAVLLDSRQNILFLNGIFFALQPFLCTVAQQQTGTRLQQHLHAPQGRRQYLPRQPVSSGNQATARPASGWLLLLLRMCLLS
jgi:hypothetical protein